MVQLKTATNVVSSTSLPALRATVAHLESLFARIDALCAFVAMAKDNLGRVEEAVSSAERAKSFQPTIRGLLSIFKRPGSKSANPNPPQQPTDNLATTPQIFKTADYF